MKKDYEIELPCLVDVWDVDEQGQEFLVKGGVIIKRKADLRYLFPEQTINNKGGVYRKRCRVYDDIRKETILVNMPYKEMIKIIDDVVNSRKTIGYKNYEVE